MNVRTNGLHGIYRVSGSMYGILSVVFIVMSICIGTRIPVSECCDHGLENMQIYPA